MSGTPSPPKNEQSEIPSVQEFCVSIPLYREYDVSKCTRQEIALKFEYFRGAIDAYCLDCGRDSVFQAHLSKLKSQGLVNANGSGRVVGAGGARLSGSARKTSKLPASHPIGTSTASPDVSQVEQKPTEIHHDDRDFDLEFRCTRTQSHRLRFYFSIKDNKICKIGQYPSLADLHQSDISKYRTVLKDKYPELARAIGLHAHDVGIGSFVYLRRVFEHLINKASEAASQETGWDEQAFEKERMPEKIKLLADHLPDFMVENANIYGILSTGIHELTEDECRTYFATVKMGIKLILDEEISRKEREANIKTTKNEIARITGEIRGQ
jgi:hypothetical protein